MIDVVDQVNAVQRQVGSRVLEAGAARTTTISQVYAATLDDLWDACTNPERIPRWFLPVSGELKVHGRYQLEGNAGGTITACDPPNGFDATWEYGGTVTWIEVRLTPEADGRTRFALEHIAHVDDEMWSQFGPGATGLGWDLAFIGLRLHLGTSAAVDPVAFQAWTVTDAGKEFVTMSSERWFEANVAAGTDADDARVAADRTTAAYTEDPAAS
jgi:uncharacterized protein YndB with AHSA1/START domain